MRKAVAVACLVAVAAFAPARARAAKPLPAGPADAPFQGKAVVVVLRSTGAGGAGGAYLADPEVRRLGDQAFIVGRKIDVEGPDEAPLVGARSWVPVGDVLQIREYETAEVLKKAFKDQLAGGGR